MILTKKHDLGMIFLEDFFFNRVTVDVVTIRIHRFVSWSFRTCVGNSRKPSENLKGLNITNSSTFSMNFERNVLFWTKCESKAIKNRRWNNFNEYFFSTSQARAFEPQLWEWPWQEPKFRSPHYLNQNQKKNIFWRHLGKKHYIVIIVLG